MNSPEWPYQYNVSVEKGVGETMCMEISSIKYRKIIFYIRENNNIGKKTIIYIDGWDSIVHLHVIRHVIKNK